MNRVWIVIGCVLSLSVGVARGAEPLSRLAGPVLLDGIPDEPAWQAISPRPLIVYQPAWGSPLEQRSEIRVAYDDEALYLGAKLYDDHPARVGSLYRDRYSGDDTVGLVVDSFNDDRNAFIFYTTPAGMRSDATVTDDMQSGESDTSWNGYWEAAATRSSYGWSAEMRIPFATLGFRAGGGQAVMGLSVYRWMARTGERQVWPPVPPVWARGYAKPSKLVDVHLSGVRSGRASYFTPYVIGGIRRPFSAADGTEAPLQTVMDAGADLRILLSPSLTLDVTANTDFAQVEADDERINLTRFPLFFPEKRQFFLERADIFAFPWERDSRLFHSRGIGLRRGQPLRIYAGTRLAGRIGAWDLGLLDMKTAAPDGSGFGENLGVARLRRRLPESGSAVGAMVTSRLTEGHGHNVVLAADADLRVLDDEFLTLKAAVSSTAGAPPEIDAPGEPVDGSSSSGSRWFVRWQRRSQQGLSYELNLARLDGAYRSDIGFEERADVGFGAGRAAYQWLGSKGALFSDVWISFEAFGYRRNSDGALDSASIESSINAETAEGHYVAVLASHATEDAREAFDVAGLEVPAGGYDLDRLELVLSGGDSLVLRPSLTLFGGSFYSGRLLGGIASLIFNPSGHFEVGGDLEANDLRLPAGQARLAWLARLRAQLAWDIHASLMTFAQYNDADGTRSISARARYNLRDGTDLWLVYDEQHAREPASVLGAPTERSARALLLKLNYTFAP